MPPVRVDLVGTATGVQRTFRAGTIAAKGYQTELRSLQVSAARTAKVQIDAAIRTDARLREQLSVYRQVAATASAGSREQIVAANLAARAEARLGGSIAVTAAEARIGSRSIHQSERELGRLTRGALAGTGALRGLGRSLAFGSGGFLTAAGSFLVIRRSIQTAEQAQVAQRQLGATMRSVGLSLAANRQQINQSIEAQSRLSQFFSEDLVGSLNRFIRRTGDVNQALRLNALAANVARARNIGLQQATTLLIRALAGNARAATTLDLPIQNLGKNATKAQVAQAILAAAQQRYARQAAASITPTERFNRTLHDSEEIIGKDVLPVRARLAASIGDYLEKLNRSGRLQTDVNNTVRQATQVVKGLRDGFRTLRDILRPVVGLLGGTRNAVKTLVILFAAKKVLDFATAISETLIPQLRNLKRAGYEAAGGVAAVDAATAVGGGAAGAGAAGGVSRLRKALATLASSIVIGGVFGTLAGGFRTLGARVLGATRFVNVLIGRLGVLGRISVLIPIAFEVRKLIGKTGDIRSFVQRNIPGLAALQHLSDRLPGTKQINEALGINTQQQIDVSLSASPGLGVHGALLANVRRRERLRAAALLAANAARLSAAAAQKRAEAAFSKADLAVQHRFHTGAVDPGVERRQPGPATRSCGSSSGSFVTTT
jgi:hypothetical protein